MIYTVKKKMYDFYLSLHVLRQYETWNSECFWKLSTVLIRSLRNKTCEQSLLKSFCSHSKLAPFSYVYHHNWRYMENWWPFTNRRWLHTPLYEFVSMTGTLGKRKRQLHCDLITIISVSTHHISQVRCKENASVHIYSSNTRRTLLGAWDSSLKMDRPVSTLFQGNEKI